MDEQLIEIETRMQGLEDLIQKLKDCVPNLPHRNYRSKRDDRPTEFLETHQVLKTTCQGLQESVRTSIDKVVRTIKSWQYDLKMMYSEMAEKSDYDIEDLATWSGKLGKIINDVIDDVLHSWMTILEENRTIHSRQRLTQEVVDLKTSFKGLLHDLIKSTFVVTSQGKTFHIKTGNKSFPKFSVRLMALELVKVEQPYSVTAHFMSEDDLNKCFHKDALNANQITKFERKLKSNEQEYPDPDNKTCQFNDLQFVQPFKRKQDQKQVHEEKYRVVFITNIDNVTYWTMSLPIVVITASNQETHCLASIMWQCYSTDVFTVPIHIPETLPWKRIAEMLKIKMSQISTNHNLTDENISHLKYRLFGADNVPDDKDVTLTMFCWTHMAGSDEERPFSFWKWFLANYNLIDRFLRSYWNEGLIMGYIKKEKAKQLLEANTEIAGSFILRFSDKHITQKDGTKNVFGYLTSCVRIRNSKGGKRKSEQPDACNNMVTVECFEVGNFENLKNTELANLLCETWVRSKERTNLKHLYCYHYPSNKSREEMFDKKCVGTAKMPVNGYTITTNAKFICLEESLMSLSLNEITDSPNIETDHSGEKKLKSIKDGYPIILDMLARESVTEHTLLQTTTSNTKPFQINMAQENTRDVQCNIPTVVQDLNIAKTDIDFVSNLKSPMTSSSIENNVTFYSLQTSQLSQGLQYTPSLNRQVDITEAQITSIPSIPSIPIYDCNSSINTVAVDSDAISKDFEESDLQELQDIGSILDVSSTMFQDAGSSLTMDASQCDTFKGLSSGEQNIRKNVTNIDALTQNDIFLPVCDSGPISSSSGPLQNYNNQQSQENVIVISFQETHNSNQPDIQAIEQHLKGLKPWLTNKQYEKLCSWIRSGITKSQI